MKKILSVLLAAVMLLSVVSMVSFAADDVADNEVTDSGECGAEGADVKWTLYSNGLLDITGTGAMKDYDYGKFSLDFRSYFSLVKCVKIGDEVTTIGDGAFAGFNKLTSVHIGKGVKTIGKRAFRESTVLTTVDIPEGVEKIDDYAFLRCSGLTSVTIPKSVETIGTQAFDGCALEEIIYGGSTSDWAKIGIGTNAFNNIDVSAIIKFDHVHRYVAVDSPKATCTTSGNRTYTCDCGYSYTVIVSPKGHDFNKYGICTVCRQGEIHCAMCDLEDVPYIGEILAGVLYPIHVLGHALLLLFV